MSITGGRPEKIRCIRTHTHIHMHAHAHTHMHTHTHMHIPTCNGMKSCYLQ